MAHMLSQSSALLRLLLMTAAAATAWALECAPPAAPSHSSSPPTAPAANVTTANSLGVSWPAVPGAVLYDVHVSLGAGAWDPFLSVTSATAEVAILDLQPATQYALSVRSRGPRPEQWTAMGPRARCSTAAAYHGGPTIRPPQGPALPDAIFVSLAGPAPPSATLYHRAAGSSHRGEATPIFAGSQRVMVGQVREASSYEVWLEVGAAGTPSPTVLHRTSSRATSFFEAYRISEECGSACQPDMLGDHDSGDLLADTSFITVIAGGGGFNISFNTSIVTRYCIERAIPPSGDWADYVSCNGPRSEDYTCQCNNWIDRCIGRLDISSCDLRKPVPPCTCSAGSLARSAKEVGRMPVYWPWPPVHGGDRNCTRAVPPAARSTHLGSWYSTPSAAACAAGVSPAASAGCSWSRRAAQHYVIGKDLHELGFNSSNATDVAELEQNHAVLKAAFEKQEARCCGC